MEPQEMTEAEQRALREGLRILARLIARHHLAATAATVEQQTGQTQPPQHSGAAKP